MEVASERKALAARAGRLLKMIAGVEPLLVSRADRARTLVTSHLDGREGLISARSGAEGVTYLVRGGRTYRVFHDGRFWYCDCPDYARKGRYCCKHTLGCWALARAAGNKVPFPLPSQCAGCNGKFPSAEVISVEESDHPTWFEGDLLCRQCARDTAVA